MFAIKFLLILYLRVYLISGEIIQIQNLSLYHVIPLTEQHAKELNQLRTSHSGILFINGIGVIGETTEIITTPDVLELYMKDFMEMKLEFDLQFEPVTIEMSNTEPTQQSKNPPSPTSSQKTPPDQSEAEKSLAAGTTEAVWLGSFFEEQTGKEMEQTSSEIAEKSVAADTTEAWKGSFFEEQTGKEMEQASSGIAEDQKTGRLLELERRRRSADHDDDKNSRAKKLKHIKGRTLSFGLPVQLSGVDDAEKQLLKTMEVMIEPSQQQSNNNKAKQVKDKNDDKEEPESEEKSESSARSPSSSSSTLPTAETAAADKPKAMKKQKFVKILPISEPDVYSGVFLNISSASKLHADLDSLSFGVTLNSTMGNPYLCLSTKKSSDGGPTDFAKQWLFEPTEEKGYYLLRNKKVLNGYVSWEDDEEQYLVIEMRKEAQRTFKVGGHYRKNALFKVTPKQGGKFFEFQILGKNKRNIGIKIDPSWAEASGCYLLRRTTKTQSPEGDNMESLFRIKKTVGSLKIFANVENLKYKETVDDLYQRAQKIGSTTQLLKKSVFNHGENEIHMDLEHFHDKQDKYHFLFKSTDDNSSSNIASSFDDIFVTAGLGIANAKDHENDHQATGPLSLVRLEKTPGQDTQEQFTYKIAASVHVEPWNSLEYSVVFGWLEKLKLAFEAEMKIYGKADRLTKSEKKPKVAFNQVVTFDFVRNALKERGFKMEEKEILKSDEESSTIFVEGTVVATTLGIKGDIETSFEELSKKISTKCK